MKILVVFHKKEYEKVNAYSLVDNETRKNIPQEIIFIEKKVEDKLFTDKELEIMRDDLLKK